MAVVGALTATLLALSATTVGAASAKQPPGVTDTTVTVGLQFAGGQAAAGSATGVTATPADIQNQQILEAILADLNKRGGLMGRQVKAVYDLFQTGAASWSANYQAACTKFTQDTPTWWVYSTVTLAPSRTLMQCLKNAKTIFEFDNGGPSLGQKSYSKLVPYLYSPAHLYQDRYGDIIAMAAKAQPDFFKGAKFGIIHQSNDDIPSIVNGVVKKALQKAGAKVVDTATVEPADSTAGTNANATNLQNAVLHFKTTGVDHIMFVGGAGGAMNTFWQIARTQTFTPKVFMTTEGLPNFQTTGTTATPDQLRGSIGVGWSPTQDVNDITGATTPGGTACLNVVRNAGFSVAVRTDQIMQMCDWVSFMEAGVKAAKSFDAQKIWNAYHKKGFTFSPARTYASAAGANRSDGVSKATVFAYDETCRCMKYSGTPTNIKGSSK